MKLWTTFTPQKVAWELSYILTKGKSPNSKWQENTALIDESIKKLKKAGISGIRLVIYPSELTTDGKVFRWEAINKMLKLSKKNKVEVDLCIGPFQYPNYPGIYLPEKMLNFVFDNKRCLDTTSQLWKYGMSFLEEQIAIYGEDPRIHGFHFANEWPDPQKVKGKEKIKTCISHAFMIECAKYLKANTAKPILLNTNIEAIEKSKLSKTFGEILGVLGDRGRLGFDVYPSQFIWKRYFIQKLLYLLLPYRQFFKSFQKKFGKCEMYFAEVEAQPWGSGQSWYQLINESENPNERVLKYANDSLDKTFHKYINKSGCSTVSLWGSDFWLAADKMGIKWPLEKVKSLH
ncbi:MAG TPA: hypothetical protein VM077_02175 [Candidatus Limnocylindrales bacterium]|nr:hypothetical protein [Candidatus Limnocylindrales bacterium]